MKFKQYLLNEKITKDVLNKLEAYVDRIFNAIDIDVKFTQHFLDRVNHVRNKIPITYTELIRLFSKTYEVYGRKIEKLNPNTEAVLNDMKTDINMPFVLVLNKNKDMEMVAKTIMRKKNFKTRNLKLKFEKINTK